MPGTIRPGVAVADRQPNTRRVVTYRGEPVRGMAPMMPPSWFSERTFEFENAPGQPVTNDQIVNYLKRLQQQGTLYQIPPVPHNDLVAVLMRRLTGKP